MIDTTYFRASEMKCKCGCGACNISQDFVNRLDHARRIAGVAFPVTSACRCRKHNKKVGGVDDSAHLSTPEDECTAVDLGIFDSVSRFKAVKALVEAGFTRIGIGKGLIHVDSDPSKPAGVIWLYADK